VGQSDQVLGGKGRLIGTAETFGNLCLRTDTLLRCIIFSGHMSELGLVSRVTPVQTAMRNCTRDEGRSFEVGNQVLISNHRKLLWSKAMVVNVAEKPEQDSGRYD
jgi:hypothetical protein